MISDDLLMAALRAAHVEEASVGASAGEEAPTRHSRQTDECPTVPRLVRAVQSGFAALEAAERRHIRGCDHCRGVLATALAAGHPGLTTLAEHAGEPIPEVERHLDGCRRCRALRRASLVVAATRRIAAGQPAEIAAARVASTTGVAFAFADDGAPYRETLDLGDTLVTLRRSIDDVVVEVASSAALGDVVGVELVSESAGPVAVEVSLDTDAGDVRLGRCRLGAATELAPLLAPGAELLVVPQPPASRDR
jgi:hypothetical protein